MKKHNQPANILFQPLVTEKTTNQAVHGKYSFKVAKNANKIEVKKAVDRARKGLGPSFLEIKTYRYKGHSMSDAQKYRTKSEVEEYKKIDPITQVKKIIVDKKYLNDKEISSIEERVRKQILECEKFAEESPYPDISKSVILPGFSPSDTILFPP